MPPKGFGEPLCIMTLDQGFGQQGTTAEYGKQTTEQDMHGLRDGPGQACKPRAHSCRVRQSSADTRGV